VSLLERARAFLDRVPLVDGHNDLPFVIRADKQARGDVAAFYLEERRDGRDTDIPRLIEGKVAAQFWAAFVPPREKQPASFALQQIALTRRMIAHYDDALYPAFEAADIARAKASNKIASFITIENGAALENRLDTLFAFYDLGVRLMTLCHNATTDWCDSATDEPRHNGLSDFGREVIAAMNDIGMIVDLAHVSPQAMHQVIDITRAPVVWSHSNARALCDHPRNVPDDVLDRVRASGGMVMPCFVPDFISQKSRDWMKPLKDEHGATPRGVNMEEVVPARERELGPWPRGTLTEYCDHLDYLRKKIGPDHLGIGSDFFGGPQGEGLKDVACFPAIFAELIQRGWPDADLEKLASGNFVRVFEGVEKARKPAR
jgi:membrane dipeptidase